MNFLAVDLSVNGSKNSHIDDYRSKTFMVIVLGSLSLHH